MISMGDLRLGRKYMMIDSKERIRRGVVQPLKVYVSNVRPVIIRNKQILGRTERQTVSKVARFRRADHIRSEETTTTMQHRRN